MSTFECAVVRVTIEPHPNADAIEIASVGDYRSIVRKGQFVTGDYAVYIPEQAVVPVWLLKHMNMWDEAKGKGGLAGGAGDRVRAIKLRGVVSQGLLLNVKPYSDSEVLVISEPGDCDWSVVAIGADASKCLGIVKYEPALPSHMVGKAIGVDLDITHNYDFENIKKHPDLFEDGEDVVITEKIHGTLLQIILVPEDKANPRYYKDRVAITSKGLGGRGVILDHTDPTNLYAQAVARHGLLEKMLSIADALDAMSEEDRQRPLILFGEVFGKTAGGAGVQDLTYNEEVLDFRAFDLCAGVRSDVKFCPENIFQKIMSELGIYRAPVLYRGPYSKEKVLELTDGKTTLIGPRGTVAHIREGVVVKSAMEGSRHHRRKIAKSISADYLLRKNSNATEFQ